MLFHSCYQHWITFEIGQEFSALFCGVVAVLHGKPIVGVGSFGPSRALIRRWTGDDQGGPFTLLELYAGIGGWSAGFDQLADAVVVAVEWGGARAAAYAASKNVPCLTIDQVCPGHIGTSFVLVANVTVISLGCMLPWRAPFALSAGVALAFLGVWAVRVWAWPVQKVCSCVALLD